MSADLTSLIATHRFMARNAAGRMGCRGCTWTGTQPPGTDAAWAEYADHVSAVITDWLAAHDREVAAGAVEAAAEAMAFTDADQLNAVEAMAEGEWQWFLWLARQKIHDRAQAIREGRA